MHSGLGLYAEETEDRRELSKILDHILYVSLYVVLALSDQATVCKSRAEYAN